MEGPPFVLVIAAAVVSRPLEVLLWRAGRLSDEAATILLLARFPIVCFVLGMIVNAQPPLLIGLTLLALLPGAMFYRFTLDLLREQARSGRPGQ